MLDYHSFTFDKLVPLLALLTMLVSIAWMMAQAQKKDTFNLEEMFHDENGKTSASRVIAFLAFAFSSWDLMSARLSGQADAEQFAYYLFAWSGALVFVKMADKWNGTLPFGKEK